MKQAVIVVGLVLILSFIISGGFSVKNSDEPIPSPDPVIGDLIGEGDLSANDKTLQLRNLKFINRSPAPSAAPSSQPSSQPSASPSCPGEKLAVDLLLDTSGSMCEPDVSPATGCRVTANSKISKLKEAVKNFATNLKPEDIVAVQQFGSNARPVLDFGQYNQALFEQRINPLYPAGQTYMRAGFILAQQTIENAQSNPSFAGYKWVLIFLSDGVPNDSSDPYTDGPDESQNPTDIADGLKNLPGNQKVQIITIGLDLNSLVSDTGLFLIPKSEIVQYAEGLLRALASEPKVINARLSATPNELNETYQQIAGTLCRSNT